MQVTDISPDETQQRGRRALRALAVFALVGGLVVFGLMPCPFALVTRQPCPGCGMTRASKALFAGDLHAAFGYHPLVFVLLPIIGVWFGLNILFYVRDGKWGWVESHTGKRITHAALVLVVVVLGVWVARFFGLFGGPVSV